MHQKDGNPASASIVAKEYFGNFLALRLDLTGRVDSASTTELIGATVADAAGSGHRDQLTDCKLLLAIESRALGNIPLKCNQRVIHSSKDRQTHMIPDGGRWHRATRKRDQIPGWKMTTESTWRTQLQVT